MPEAAQKFPRGRRYGLLVIDLNPAFLAEFGKPGFLTGIGIGLAQNGLYFLPRFV